MAEKHPTFWANIEKIENSNIYNYVKGYVPNTRYVILFNLYNDTCRISFSKSLYNSKSECFNECDELDKMYANHPLPKKIVEDNKYDYGDGKSWWGYIVLDFVECKIIRVGGTGFYVSQYIPLSKNLGTHIIDKIRIGNKAEMRDYFFRDVDKVPDNYAFDDGEYEGWLQFKWGDGKNAVDYVAPPKKRKQELCYDIETEVLTEFPEPETYNTKSIQQTFADLLNKETREHLMNKYSW